MRVSRKYFLLTDMFGKLYSIVELRRLFPGVDDMAKAREFVRIIAGWKPLPARLEPR
jgi:hypothetical protein